MKSYCSFILLSAIFFSCNSIQPEPRLSEKLWYRQPAENWFSGLAIGNGRMGAMVYGGVKEAHLQLNEESLWAGEPENPYPPDLEKHFRRFQELNLQAKYEEAKEYGMKYLTFSPTSIRSYEPLGDLFIRLDHKAEPDNYKRSLDLESGVVSVSYQVDEKEFLQESFVSADYDVVVFHFQSLDGQPVDASVAFERVEDIELAWEEGQIHVIGQIYDDPKTRDDNPGGSGKTGYHMKFDARVGLLSGGQMDKEQGQLSIPQSTEFTVLLSATTDYNLDSLNFDHSIDVAGISADKLQQALALSYEEIKDAHIKTHAAAYNRVELKLRHLEKDTIPTDIRLKHVIEGKKDPYLAQVLFQYGRYLLMGSSGFQAKLPANLQGIWNQDMWAAWESDYHININLQMNYWPADITNLSETMVPLSNWLVKHAERGKENAQKFIGSEGWVAHHATNVFGRTMPNGSTRSSQLNNGYSSQTMGAWMSLTLWRHFEFNLDTTYLREAVYPVISGASRYILDLMQEKDGQFMIAPSYSPENTYIDPVTGKSLKNTISSTIDLQISKELFYAVNRAEEILEIGDGLSEEIDLALSKMPEINRIGKDGTIMEWIEDYEEAEPGHRHVSHLFGLYPGTQIGRHTPELLDAARKTLERRLSFGGGQTGWSRAWMLSFFARLFDGEACEEHIYGLMKEQLTPSLLDLHPPRVFQIDGNLGLTAGMAEMLLQSHRGVIELLPALPEAWAEGEFRGLKARGGFEVSCKWKDHSLLEVKVHSVKGAKGRLLYREQSLELQLKAGESATFSVEDFN